jgi:kynurenine formamidase
VSSTKKNHSISEDLHLRELPGVDYSDDEIGLIHSKKPQDIVSALSLATKGQIYDLDSGRWAGMPLFPAHPPFILTSYRSPHGWRNQHDYDDWLGKNSVNMGLNTEIMIGTAHTGTHVDALNHITCGDDSHWHGGYSEADFLGDFGPLTAEASSIAPFICRGVLIDIAAYKGVDILPGADHINVPDVEGALERQGVEVREGDAVIFRTGYMQVWGTDPERTEQHAGAGIDHDVAVWLGERGVVLVGGDTESVERNPSADPENPHPVHIELLIKRGIHIMELVHVEDLARDGVNEFLFICLPLRIKGATGSMVRPVAIV